MLSMALNKIGCKIAIEHYRFETQPQHLKHVHVDYLKIDSELVYYSSVSSLSSTILSGITFTGYHTENTSCTLLYGNVLSGLTFSAAHDGGVAIAQLPTSAGENNAPDGGWVSASSSMPRGNIMVEKDAQMFVAGASGVSGNVVYYSAVNEPTNYAISAIAGGGGTARYPETIGSITALTDYDAVLTVMKENTIRRLEFQSVADGTSGTLEIVNRTNLATAPKVGSINMKGLVNAENDVFYVSPTGWVKSLSKTDAGSKTSEISLFIRPTVEGWTSPAPLPSSSTGSFMSPARRPILR